MKLSPRERNIVAVAVVVIAAVLAFELVLSPRLSRRDTLSRVLPRRREQLTALRRDAAEYQRRRAEIAAFRRELREQPANFSLLSFVEDLERQRKLLDHEPSIDRSISDFGADYQRIRVQLDLKAVTLDQVLGLLEDLEAAPAPVVIDLLHVRHSRAREGFLDLTVGVSLLRPKEQS